jgi:hypothetical protein
MLLISFIAVLVSAIPILILCMGDPKRLRAAGESKAGMRSGARRLLAIAACLPGIACISLGQIAAFVLWLGGCALFGWLLSALFQYQSAAQKP